MLRRLVLAIEVLLLVFRCQLRGQTGVPVTGICSVSAWLGASQTDVQTQRASVLVGLFLTWPDSGP